MSQATLAALIDRLQVAGAGGADILAAEIVAAGAGIGIGAGNAPDTLLVRSASIFGTNQFGWDFDDLIGQTLYRWTNSGPLVIDATHGFGVWSANNLATQVGFKTVIAVAAPNVTPWHFAGRMRLITAPGGAEFKGASLDSGGANNLIRAGLNGTISTTKFSFWIDKAAAITSSLSTVSLDTTNFHVMEMWFDGTSVWGSVDSEAPVLVTTAANLPTVALSDRFGCHAAAGGAAGSFFDWFYSAAQRTAT